MEQKLLEQLETIFNPNSVAIVGISNKEYNLGYRWLKSLQVLSISDMGHFLNRTLWSRQRGEVAP